MNRTSFTELHFPIIEGYDPWSSTPSSSIIHHLKSLHHHCPTHTHPIGHHQRLSLIPSSNVVGSKAYRQGNHSFITPPITSTDSLIQELAEITRSPPDGIRVSLISESDIHKWQILMDGPSQSPYAVCLPFLHLCSLQILLTNTSPGSFRAGHSPSTSSSQPTTPSSRRPSPSKPRSTTQTSPMTTKAPCA